MGYHEEEGKYRESIIWFTQILWIASLTQWTRFEQTLGEWKTEEPGVGPSMGLQEVRHGLVTE